MVDIVAAEGVAISAIMAMEVGKAIVGRASIKLESSMPKLHGAQGIESIRLVRPSLRGIRSVNNVSNASNSKVIMNR